MPRRRFTSSLALPWERRGSRIREMLAPERWRWAAVLLAAGLVGALIWQSAEERERVRQTRAVIAEVRRALALFRDDVGRCPHTVRELVHPSRTGARYLRETPVDGWGNPLWIRCPGRYDEHGVDVISAGPSGNLLVDDNIQ